MPEDLMTAGMKILKKRRVDFVDEFVPYYIASAGVHLFNLSNQQRHFYTEFGELPNLRLQLMMVTSPGWAKTFLGNQLVHPMHGLLHNIRDSNNNLLLKTGFEAYMTEAGWVGTLEPNPLQAQYENQQRQIAAGISVPNPMPKPEPIVTYGMAHEYKEGIVCIDEFSALAAAMGQQHSASLDTAILSSIDTGRVRKRLKAGLLQYDTNLTTWMGTQPARFDLSSGLGRRLFFILWVPSKSDQVRMIKAHWAGKNVPMQRADMSNFKDMVRDTITAVEGIRKVEFERDFQDHFNSVGRPHFEITLFERLAIGYIIMRGAFDKTLSVNIDRELRRLFDDGCDWRDRLMTESECDQILQVLEEAGDKMKESALKTEMTKLGVTHTHCEELLQRLMRFGMIRKRTDAGGVRWIVRRR